MFGKIILEIITIVLQKFLNFNFLKFSKKNEINKGANIYIGKIYLVSLCPIKEIIINVNKVIHVKILFIFLIQKRNNAITKKHLVMVLIQL